MGTYDQCRVQLKAGQSEAYRDVNRYGAPASGAVVVQSAKTAVLLAGGPLTNSVSPSRNGRNLSLSYQLLGVDGSSYTLGAQDRSSPPLFTVYKGAKAIHSGKFEFG